MNYLDNEQLTVAIPLNTDGKVIKVDPNDKNSRLRRRNRRELKQDAKNLALGIDVPGREYTAEDYANGNVMLTGKKNRVKLFDRTFNKHYSPNIPDISEPVVIDRSDYVVLDPTTLSADKLNNLSPEEQRAVARWWRNPNRLLGPIGGGMEDPIANMHARNYVKPLIDGSVFSIGGAMLGTNPITRTALTEGGAALKETLPYVDKGVNVIKNWWAKPRSWYNPVQTLKTLVNPKSANTAIGEAAAATADLAGVYYSAKANESLIDKWRSGNFHHSDIPQFGLNVAGMLPGMQYFNDYAPAVAQAGKWMIENTTNAAKQLVNGEQPALGIVANPRLFGTDSDMMTWENNFTKANTDDIERVFKRGLENSKNKGGVYAARLLENNISRPDAVDSEGFTLLQKAREKFGDDFLVEAIPAHSEYFAHFDPKTSALAKEAFKQEMLSGQGLAANGAISRMSGSEIAQRGLAKQQGFGNNGIVLLRSAPKEELLSIGTSKASDAPIYTMFGEPGIVDKYVVAPRGTTLPDMQINHHKYVDNVAKLQALQRQYLNLLKKGIDGGNRAQAINGMRGYMWTTQVLPSTMQHYNVISSKGVKIADEKAPEIINALSDRAHVIGQSLYDQVNDALKVNVNDIVHGDVPLLNVGLTREYPKLPGLRRVGNHLVLTGKEDLIGTYPIIMSDAAESMVAPDMKQVIDAYAPKMLDELRDVPSHSANAFRHRANMGVVSTPGKITSTPDNYVKLASKTPVWPQMTDAIVHHSVDGTGGAGLFPGISIVSPYGGHFKHLVPQYRPNGVFQIVPGLKRGGILKNNKTNKNPDH